MARLYSYGPCMVLLKATHPNYLGPYKGSRGLRLEDSGAFSGSGCNPKTLKPETRKITTLFILKPQTLSRNLGLPDFFRI